MAAGRLPAPGTEYGPCAEPCQHRDCAESRRGAEYLCGYCSQPIGYDVRFYQYDKALTHALCEERAFAAERAKGGAS